MTLFPRTAADHHDSEYRNRAWAHATLDLWRAGEDIDRPTVESALRITGDLLAAGSARGGVGIEVAE